MHLKMVNAKEKLTWLANYIHTHEYIFRIYVETKQTQCIDID
jgi:hypothetical protein